MSAERGYGGRYTRLKAELLSRAERDHRGCELRLVYGNDWAAAQAEVERTRWNHWPESTPHEVAVQLGKAGVVAPGELRLALLVTKQVLDSAEYYSGRSVSLDRALAAAEFVGTMNAHGCIEGSVSAFRAAHRVTFP